jgi:hypothetical protein
MREQPDGQMLLAIARNILREQLLPLLPKEQHYQALMIANAMSIAERQLQYGDAPQQREQQALMALLQQDGDLLSLQRELVQRIRAGWLDDQPQGKQLLWEMTEQRVRESAPKSLQRG